MIKVNDWNERLFSRHWDVIFIGLFFAILAWLYQGYFFGHGNHGQEIPPILAMINPDLYLKDFAVQDYLLPGTRYAYYSFVAWCSTFFNIKVDFVLLILKIFSQLSFYVATACIYKEVIKSISKISFEYNKQHTILFGVFATACTFPLLSWGSSIYYSAMIPSTLAMALAIWSLYFAIKQKWLLAFAFSAAAVPIQFLVGFFSALVLIPALLVSVTRNKSLVLFFVPITILLIPVFSVYIVTILADQQVPESFNFIEVFGHFRAPHHWLPSTGAWYLWMSDFLLLVAATIAAILLWKTNKKSRNLVLLFAGMVLVTISGVVLNVLFVEVFPLTLIGKLQFQRVIPFGHLAIYLIVIASLYNALIENGRHLSLSVKAWSIISCFLLIPSILAFPLLSWFPGFNFILSVMFVIGFMIYGFLSKVKRIILLIAAFGLLFLVNTSILNKLPEPISKRSNRYQPVDSGQWSGIEISQWLSENSPIDTLVIIPPDWSPISDLLAMHSKRSVFFSFKNVPYSNYGVWMWSKRAELLLDVQVDPNLNRNELRSIWAKRTQSEITTIAENYGACFLVDRLVDRTNFDLDLISTSWVTNDEEWGLWRFNHCRNN